MRILIGIVTCHKRIDYTNEQRKAWVKDAAVDLRFFFGKGEHPNKQEDEVILDCDDSYNGLCVKVQMMYKWALSQGYDYIFKTDDDTLVYPDRLLKSGFEKYDYSGGILITPHPCYVGGCKLKHSFLCGGGYWLSKKSMEILIDTPIYLGKESYEDHWVGNNLYHHNIFPYYDWRYSLIYSAGPKHTGLHNEKDVLDIRELICIVDHADNHISSYCGKFNNTGKDRLIRVKEAIDSGDVKKLETLEKSRALEIIEYDRKTEAEVDGIFNTVKI